MIRTARSSIGSGTCTSHRINSSDQRPRISLEGKPRYKVEVTTHTYAHSLICDPQNRLGRNGGAAELKAHPFFHGVDWSQLRRIRAPFEPKLQSNVDTQYFPIDEIPQVDNSAQLRAQTEAGMANSLNGGEEASMSLPFIGYTYKRFDAFRGS